jgi:allantoicase
MTIDPFETFPDLASQPIGGSVLWSNDELFAARENLVAAHDPGFQPHTFGPRGQVYDGWETRRRRVPGNDAAIVSLGVNGLVHAIDIDTSHFIGNYPPEASIEVTTLLGYPDPVALQNAEWRTLLPRQEIQGNAHNRFVIDEPELHGGEGSLVTHVRLQIYPDGGVARLRVHGRPLPDPRMLDAMPFDLAALENGGRVTATSNGFYGSPDNLILPGPARTMGEGWETARRRGGGYDWVEFKLAAPGTVRLLELDMRHFVGNAPGVCRVLGRFGTPDSASEDVDPTDWFPLLVRTTVQPDTLHRLLIGGEEPVTHLRLEAYPDGGMARLRAFGIATADARQELWRRWLAALPNEIAAQQEEAPVAQEPHA